MTFSYFVSGLCGRIKEQIAEAASLQVVADEETRLTELIAAADEVRAETKIEQIVATIDTRFPDRSVLFFTEYKAAQSLLMSALNRRYGVLATVRSLVGHCARFDFQEMSDRIPKLDLPGLRPFFLAMLSLNNRRPQETEAGLSFKTPDNWLNSPAARTTCRDMRFSREAGTVGDVENVLGVGHVLFDEAVSQARGLEAQVAGIPATVLSEPLIVFRITEQVTSHDATIRSVLAGVQFDETGQVRVLQDWELLDRINRLLEKRTLRRDPAVANTVEAGKVKSQIDEARRQVQQRLAALDVSFVVPDIQLFAVLCPVKGDTQDLPDSSD